GEGQFIRAALCRREGHGELADVGDLFAQGGIHLEFGFERSGGQLILRVAHDEVGELEVGLDGGIALRVVMGGGGGVHGDGNEFFVREGGCQEGAQRV